MRLIGHVTAESAARTFGDYLYVLGIDNQVDFEKDSGWAIWIRDEDRIKEAADLLAGFRANPADPKYTGKAKAASALRAEKEKNDNAFRKRVHEPAQTFAPLGGYRPGPVTLSLVLISIGIYLLTRLSGVVALWLYISLPDILHGQVWRLVTPIFLHSTFLHILFNMLWLHDLGSMIEGRQGSRQLLLLVLIIGAVSNLAQYFVIGPFFGGMSGVVYGLLGYIWIRGRFDPGCGLYLHQATVLMMLIWLVLCLLQIIPNVANTTHVTGLVLGAAWGYLSSSSANR